MKLELTRFSKLPQLEGLNLKNNMQIIERYNSYVQPGVKFAPASLKPLRVLRRKKYHIMLYHFYEKTFEQTHLKIHDKETFNLD